MLAYVVDETDGTADIWVAALDGSDARRVIDCQPPCAFAEDPTWSPDGTKLAYWTNGTDDPTLQQVIIANVATGDTQTVLNAGKLTGPVNPKFSPDGTHLALEVGTYAQAGSDFQLVSSEIAVVDLTAPTPLVVPITDGMLAGYPDWNPTGDRIIFQAGNVDPFSHNGDVPELYTVRQDGSELTQITHHVDGDPWPALPDWTSDPAMPILVTAIASSTNYSLATLSLADGQITALGGVAGPFPGAHPRRS
jgi:Tol biopolymer transport system component